MSRHELRRNVSNPGRMVPIERQILHPGMSQQPFATISVRGAPATFTAARAAAGNERRVVCYSQTSCFALDRC
jgi:hypothetical protein